MPQSTGRGTESVEAAQAEAQARAVAPGLRAILFTHCEDAETLALLRPAAGDLATAAVADRAAAAVLVAAGVKVFVQRGDRVRFAEWMETRGDVADARPEAWRDRGRLLAGGEALALLGLDPKLARPRPGRGSGSPAERLMRAFLGEDVAAFEAAAQEVLEAGRDGVIEVALRKAADRYGDEAAEDLAEELWQLAEGAAIGPSGWAELAVLPFALPAGPLPDAAALGRGFLASGALPESVELRLLPEWRMAEAVEALGPGSVRRVLLNLVAGRPPAELPPAPGALEAEGFAVLLGLRLDWDIPQWDQVAAEGLTAGELAPELPEDAPPTPAETARAEAFARWREAIVEATAGCQPLGLVPPSELAAEIEDFLAGDEDAADGLEEIREFVAMAQREVPGEEVVCRPEVIGETLELSLYTRAGRFLDSLRLGPEQLPARAEAMPAVIAGFVPLVKDTPG